MPKKIRTDGEVRKYGAGRITYRLGKTSTTYQASVFLGLKVDGKQDMPKKTFHTEADAEAWVDRMSVDSRRGALTTDRRKRVWEVLAAYMAHQGAENAKGNLTPRTLADYTRVNRKLVDVLPNVEVTSLTAQHVQTAVTTLATTYALDTPRTEVMVDGKRRLGAPKKATPQEGNRALLQLRRVLKFAQSRDWVFKNVAERVKTVNLNARKGLDEDADDAQEAWEPSQAAAFLKAAIDHRLYALFYMALSYGCRVGELMGLKWSDIEEQKLQVRIVRSYDPLYGLGNPKWNSARTLDITEATMTVLRTHKANQERERALERKGRKYEQNGLVFPTSFGTYNDHGNIQDRFERLIKIAGVPRIVVHGMRHTAASAMIRAGDDVVLVAGVLGHKDPSVTLKVYAHVFAEHRRSRARDADTMYNLPAPATASARSGVLN